LIEYTAHLGHGAAYEAAVSLGSGCRWG
jgi:hypothetical protein